WSITTWLTGKVTTFSQLLITRAIMGLSEACYLPAALALIMDYHKGSTQSRATGIHQAGMIVGGSLGFLGALMTEHHDWSFAFSIFGVIGVAFTLVVMLVLKEAPKTENLPDKTEQQEKSGEKVAFMDALKHLFTNKSFIYLAIFWGIVGIFAQLEAAWLPTFYQEKFNLTQTRSGFLATACLSPAQVAGLLLGGFIADWWSRRNKYSRISIPIIGIVIAAPCAFLGSFIPVLWAAVGFFLMYGMFRMFVDTNLMPIICATVDSRYRATGYGMMNMFTTVLGGLAAFIAGHLRDGGYDIRLIFMAMAATLTVSAVFLVLIKRDVKKKDAAAIQQ
ncbi:MAG: MFS transporter, partial [Bacteroidales bacterium]|nr:MFS transporter [Bacteroidales bacterium]